MMPAQDMTGLGLLLNRTASDLLLVEDDSNKILGAIIERDDDLSADKNFCYRNVRVLHEDILRLEAEMDLVNRRLLKLASLFKSAVKKEKFSRFADSVDSIPFEFFLSKKEVDALLLEQKI